MKEQTPTVRKLAKALGLLKEIESLTSPRYCESETNGRSMESRQNRIRYFLPPISQSDGDLAVRVMAMVCHTYHLPRPIYESLWRQCRDLNRYLFMHEASLREPAEGTVEAEDLPSYLTAAEADALAANITATLKSYTVSEEHIEAFMASNRVQAREQAIKRRLEGQRAA